MSEQNLKDTLMGYVIKHNIHIPKNYIPYDIHEELDKIQHKNKMRTIFDYINSNVEKIEKYGFDDSVWITKLSTEQKSYFDTDCEWSHLEELIFCECKRYAKSERFVDIGDNFDFEFGDLVCRKCKIKKLEKELKFKIENSA